ncbi:HD domain-containing protein [Bisporella sp. PMI_857]|nr:HD domain-containing protein [Bisporella sp. PMI_857]
MASLQAELHGTTLPFLHLMDVLKHLPRTGWLRTINHPESVASHMYRMALIAMTAPGLDRDKCIKLAITHDMGEALAGDLTPHDGVSKAEKFKLEKFGFKYIQSLLNKVNPELGQELMDLWVEFEDSKTPEAKWMHEVDKFECMIQAHDYEQQTYGEKDLEEFQGPYNAAEIISPRAKDDLRLLTLERKAHFANRAQTLPLVFLIAVPGSGEKEQADLLATDGKFKVVDIKALIQEKSQDRTYLHHEFLAECIENTVRPPTVLVVGLLEEKIKEVADGGKNWVVVVGFPDSMQQLIGFRRQVQKNTYTLLLRSSTKAADLSEKKYTAATRDMKELEADLGTVEGYFKAVDADGSPETVYGKVNEAVLSFTKHKDSEK